MVVPCTIAAGKHTPSGVPAGTSPSASMICFTVATMSSGSPPCGVGSFTRSLFSSPVATSTMAPLMPVPPMSMPIAVVASSLMEATLPARPTPSGRRARCGRA